jgi:hypothetical protein
MIWSVSNVPNFLPSNIQDLGLSAASQHSVGGQPILWVIFFKLSILERRFYSFRKFFQDIGRQPIP